MSSTSKPRAIIVPGNGCPPGKVHKSNWYGWMQEQLAATGLFSDVVLRDMPDPFGAKESAWVPFLLQECGVDANTLIIGHSSGAEAAMRLMENNPVLVYAPSSSAQPHRAFFILLYCRAACWCQRATPTSVLTTKGRRGTTTGRGSGRISDKTQAPPSPPLHLRARAFIVLVFKHVCIVIPHHHFTPPPTGRAGITQFHSDDDPFIPVAEAQHVADSLTLGARFHLLSGHSHFFSKEDAAPILQAIKNAVA